MQDKYFKVIFIGDTAVGKTSIIHQIKKQTLDDIPPTAPAEIQVLNRVVDNVEVKFQISDTAGQERYRSIVDNYYRDSDVVVMVYAINNWDSFINIEYWSGQVTEKLGNSAGVFLVANKIDLLDNLSGAEIVSSADGNKKAQDIGAQFFEVSALTNMYIDDLFDSIARFCASKNPNYVSTKIKNDDAHNCC